MPLLPLETLRPCWCEPGAYAVIDAEQVLVASREAAQGGVRPGMRAGGVAAIAPGTVLLERVPAKETAALDAIAMALMQYTPEVRYGDDYSVLLDVSASLTLFGGPAALCRRVAASIAALGFSATLGAAPTTKAAWLLARSPREQGRPLRRRVLTLPAMTRRLDALPFPLLPSTRPFHDWFIGIGARDLGALRRLPRTGLMRRTSKQLIEDLDSAYGDRAEMFEWLKAPPTFSAHVETFDRIEHAEALMFGATRLIVQMTGWLVAQQQAVSSFALFLEHERGRAAIAPTPLEITLAEPAWREEHLLRLLKERLGKIALTAPVIGLRLDARQQAPMLPPTTSLFPEPGGSPADFNRLLDMLTARLGAEHVLTPAAAPDHRPEVCNVWVPATQQSARKSEAGEHLERPFWILPQPIPLLMRQERPFYGSPLKMISGPERIEAGWWNDQTAARDYYVAQGTDTSCYWIYLERTRDARWYLHGLYA